MTTAGNRASLFTIIRLVLIMRRNHVVQPTVLQPYAQLCGGGTLKNPVPTRSVRSHSYPPCTHPAGVLPEHMLTKVQGSESQVPQLKPSILKFKHLFRQLFTHSYRTNVK